MELKFLIFLLFNFTLVLTSIEKLDKESLKLNSTIKSYKLNLGNEGAPPTANMETLDAAPLADSMYKSHIIRKETIEKKEDIMFDKPGHEKKEENKKEEDNEIKNKEIFIKDGLFEVLLENAIGIGVRSSLRNYKYLIQKDFKKYVKKIGKNIGINTIVKIIFYYLKGIYKQIGQYGFTIFSIAMEFKGNSIKEGIINSVVLLITILLYGIIHKICKKLFSKNLVIRGTSYGVFTFLIDTILKRIKNKFLDDKFSQF
jgi:hypothetical protein